MAYLSIENKEPHCEQAEVDESKTDQRPQHLGGIDRRADRVVGAQTEALVVDDDTGWTAHQIATRGPLNRWMDNPGLPWEWCAVCRKI